jgi:hypothetical protein
MWGSTFTQWGLVWTAMSVGYAIGYWRKLSASILYAVPFTLIPLAYFSSILGLVQLAILMAGIGYLMRGLSERHFIRLSYVGVLGFAAAYLVIMPFNILWILPLIGGLLSLKVSRKLCALYTLCGALALLFDAPLAGVLHRHWTPNGWVVVMDTGNERSVGFRRGYTLAIQSKMDKDAPNEPQGYIRTCADLFLQSSGTKPKSILELGTGGAGFVKWSHARYPQSHILTVDISARMQQLAKTYFMADQPGIVFHVEDARSFLLHSEDRYDWVFFDLYNYNTPPTHVLTSEFLTLLSDSLSVDGILVFNVLYQKSWWIPLASTIREAFPEHVITFYTKPSGQGIVILSPSPVDYLTPEGYLPTSWPQPVTPLTDRHNVTIIQ